MLVILLPLLSWWPTAGQAADAEVTVTWTMPTNSLDQTPLTDLAGAKVYYGTSTSNYTSVIDVGMTNRYTVTGLQSGVTYYLNGTAYNTAGLESDFCVEIAKVAVFPAPTGLEIPSPPPVNPPTF